VHLILESVLINGATTKVKVNLTVTGVVTYANNAAALDNLETLMINHQHNAKRL
jgi:hypothetical protein